MTKFVGSKIINLKIFCLKKYGIHKHLQEVSALVRLQREILGARLLNSGNVIIAKPIYYNYKRLLLLRKWYNGFNFSYNHQYVKNHLLLLARWGNERKYKGYQLPNDEYSQLPLKWFFKKVNFSLNNPLALYVLNGVDLLHGDLVSANVLFRKEKPIILDLESVCMGSLIWDIAQIVVNIIGLHNKTLVDFFLKNVDLKNEEVQLTIELSNLFINKMNQ